MLWLHSKSFGMLYINFCLFQYIFWFLLWLLLCPIDCLVAWRSVFTFMWIFQVSLLLISFFIPLWLEKILYMTSVFLNWLKHILWPDIWSILENIPWMLERCVFSAAVGWNVLCMSVIYIWSEVSFGPYVFSLIFCTNEL